LTIKKVEFSSKFVHIIYVSVLNFSEILM